MIRMIRSLSLLSLMLWASFAFAQPANDNPCAATTLTVGITCSDILGTNVSATSTAGIPAPGCGNYQGGDVWFTAIVGSDGTLDIETSNSGGISDPAMAVYTATACGGTYTLEDCDDDGGTASHAQISINDASLADQTVYIRVWEYGNNSFGTFDICATSNCPSTGGGNNDMCVNAEPIILNVTEAGSVACASPGTDDPDEADICAITIENTVWYSFSSATTQNVYLDVTSINCSSGSGIQFGILTGTCGGTYTSIDCADGSSDMNFSFTATGGTTYYLVVDGIAGAQCDFDIDITPCSDAGSNISPAFVELCANASSTQIDASGVTLPPEPNACLVWGLWVLDDPLGNYPTMTNIGDAPTGGFPNDDPNFAGIFSPNTYPLAVGTNPTIPSLNDGTTYYIAPITANNCNANPVTIDETCFDVGNATQIYFNPEITYNSIITCDNAATPTVQVTIAIAGGLPSIDGSNYTVDNTGNGTLAGDPISIAEGVSFTITGVPDNGDVTATITDGNGCTTSISIIDIDASSFCPSCVADAGTTDAAQTGTITRTDAPYTISDSPFILCYGDQLDLSANGVVLPPTVPWCTTSMGTAPPEFSMAGSEDCWGIAGWAVDNAAPTSANPDNDNSFTNFGFIEPEPGPYEVTLINDNSWDASNNNLPDALNALISNGNLITNNTIWFVPVVGDYYESSTQSYLYDLDGDGCFASGLAIPVTFLNEMEAITLNRCNGPEITISGGYPEFFGGNYTITNNGSGTITGLPVTHGGTIVIDGLTSGQSYDIDITDPNGCTINYVGTYTFTPPTVSIAGLATDFCENSAVDAFTGSPTPYTITTGTFTVNYVSDNFEDETSWEIFDANGTLVGSRYVYSGFVDGGTASNTVSGLNPANGPFTMYVYDSFGDGFEDYNATVDGSISVTNTSTGQVVNSVVGDFGREIILPLGNFYSTTGTFSGLGVTQTGTNTANFDPSASVGTGLVVNYTYDNGEGCSYTATQTVNVYEIPDVFNITVDECESTAGSGTYTGYDLTSIQSNWPGGYSFSWFTDAGMTMGVAVPTSTNITNGSTFYVSASDAVTGSLNCGNSASVAFTIGSRPAITVTDNDISCNGLSDGTISTTVSGGVTPYYYTWSNGATTSSISGLATGTYTVTVLGDNGCFATGSATITQPTALSLSSSQTNVLCNGASTGAVNLSVSGGTTAYTYSWSSTQTTEDLSSRPAGTYTVTVTDSEGCTSTRTVTITQPATALSASITTPSTLTCLTTSITLSSSGSSGGTTAYTHSWSSSGGGNITSGSGTATPTINAAGVYTVTVTDANLCTDIESVTVTSDVATPTISVTCTSPSTIGGADGSVASSVSGGSTPYTYLWSNAGTSTSISGVSAATYTVTVTGANGCTDTDNCAVTNPPCTLTITASSNPTSCNGGTDGEATVTPSGGVTNYSYLWSSSAQTTITATGLTSGNYTVTVTDAVLCSRTTTVSVSQPAVVSVTSSSTSVACNGASTGGVNISISGGSGAGTYTFLWSNGSTTEDLSSVPANTYIVTVTDANSCTSAHTATVTQPATAVAASIAVPSTITCNTTSFNLDASSSSGGTGALTFSWSSSGGGNITAGGATSTPTVDAGGVYTVTVTDVNSCSDIESTTVTEDNTAPTVGVVCNNTTIIGGTDGSSVATPAGGTAPYTFAWSNGQTDATATGLSAGSQTVTVTGANGCEVTGSCAVNDPGCAITLTPSSNDASCNGGSDGDATVVVSGETGTPDFVWSNGQTDATATGLISGSYTVTVTDDALCEQTASVSISQPAAVGISSAVTNVACNGESTGGINISVSGGTGVGTYTFLWSNASTDEDATGLAAATYTVTVTDGNTCTGTHTATVTEPATAVSAVIDVPTALTCSITSTSLDASLSSGGTGALTFNWGASGGGNITAGAGTDSPTIDATGVYTVTVSDVSSCESITSVTVTDDVVAPTVGVVCTNTTTIGGSDGTSEATPAGGTAPYTFLWANGETTSLVTGLSSGSQSVTVTGANGCTVTDVCTVNDPGCAITLTPSSNDVSCNGGSDGDATVVVTGSDGFDNFTWSNLQTAATATGLATGTYTVTVVDGSLCSQTASISISEPTIINLSSSQTDVLCNGASTGGINVSISGGVAPYIYSWSNSSTDEDITGIADGVYTVTATDDNLCTTVLSATITEPATATSAVIDPVGQIDCATSELYIDASSSIAGTGTLDFSWSSSAGGTISAGALTSNITVTSTGVYTLTVTDDNLCESIAEVTVTDDLILPVLNTTCTDVSVLGGTDGASEVSVTGTSVPYTYLWSDASSQTTNSATGLGVGVYTVTVTGANGCTETASCVVSDISCDISVTLSANDVTCNGASTGEVTATPAGSGTSFTYEWNVAQTTISISGLPAGTYDLTVTDNLGCMETSSISVSEPVALDAVSTCNNPTVVAGSDGSVSVLASGGLTNYTYLWSEGTTVDNISSLPAGNYTVTVTDANSCTSVASCNLTDPGCAVTATISSSDNVSCNGANDGEATADLLGGGTTLTYIWSNFQGTATVSGLSPNTYSVTISDEFGCTDATSLTITEPSAPLAITVTCTDATTVGGSDGFSVALAAGGTTDYTYLWGDGQTDQTAINLSAGNIFVTATDANGCTIADNCVINDPSCALTLTPSSVDVNCVGGSDGVAIISASGANTDFTYQWFNGETTTSVSGLAVGTYDVTVVDGTLCDASASVTVSEPSTTLAGGIINISGENCNSADGTAEISATDGTAPYTYIWSSGAQTDVTATGLVAGTILVTITDDNGCTLEVSDNVPSVGGPNVTLTPFDITCNGLSDGSISTTVVGGTGTITYGWSTGSGGSSVNGLGVGTYTVTVSDLLGCEFIASADINQPSAISVTSLSTTIGCNGGTDGTATVTPSGGASTVYNFAWGAPVSLVQVGLTSSTATGLGQGIYSVTVVDANVCSATLNVTVDEPGLLSITVTPNDISCSGLSDGSLTTAVDGGTTPYSYLWNPSGAITSSLSGRGVGTYSVTVTDDNSCSAVGSASITQPSALSITVTASPVTCNGADDGSVSVISSGGSGVHTYNWSNSASGNSISGLTSATYTVTATDDNGCTISGSGFVDEPEDLTVPILKTDASCGDDNGAAKATPEGGMTPYTYMWDSNAFNQTEQTATGLVAGVYWVTVSDFNGCLDSNFVLINNPEPRIISEDSTNVSCFGGSDGTAFVFVIGGTTPYSFVWMDINLDSINYVNPVDSLSEGLYFVEVSDNTLPDNCKVFGAFDISAPDEIVSIVGAVTDVSCNGISDGTTAVTASGGVTPYTYLWSNGETDINAVALSQGEHFLTISDNNGCTEIASTTITEPDTLVSDLTVVDVNCFGDATGSVDVTVSGGATPYSYQWDINALFQTTASITGLEAGDFEISITDAKNCLFVDTASILQPASALTVVETIIDDECEQAIGEISIVASGGTSGYIFVWSNAETNDTIVGLVMGGYAVTATDALGCTLIENYSVGGTALPNAPMAGNDAVYCENDQKAPMWAVPLNGTINWYNNSSLTTSIGSGITFVPANIIGTTVYYAAETNVGCQGPAAQITITVKDSPALPTLVGDTACLVSETEITANSSQGYVIWYNSIDVTDSVGTGATFTPTNINTFDTTYTYYAQAMLNGCPSGYVSTTVFVPDSIDADITVTPDNGTADLNVKLTATVFGLDSLFDSYKWVFGDGDSSTEFTSFHTFKEIGTFTVEYTATNIETGCVIKETHTVTTDGKSFLEVPNIFTPNNDGVNDLFRVDNNNIIKIDASIFNRWGQLIYQWDKPMDGWDGRTFAGESASDGTYYYIIKAEGYDGTTYEEKGSVTLMK